MTGAATVRPATLADVPEIQAVHASCDDPWADPAECAIWVNHRILRGFLVDVALLNGSVVGHAEWIVSHEPLPYGRHLYLGMVQIHSDHQRQGVGRAMIEAGLQNAKKRSCLALRTVPEDDARGFYESCQFTPYLETETYIAKVDPRDLSSGWRLLRTVPNRVVRTLPMRWGWVQGSSAHMWEIGNRPVRLAAEELRRPCAGRSDGSAYVQLHCWEPGPQAMALSWATPEQDPEELISAAMALARRLPVETLKFTTIRGEQGPLTEYCDAIRVSGEEVWSRRIG